MLISKGDIVVGEEQIDSGNKWWGFWVIFLTFLPNIIFVVWYMIKRRRHLGKLETWRNVFVVGNIQIITLLK